MCFRFAALGSGVWLFVCVLLYTPQFHSDQGFAVLCNSLATTIVLESIVAGSLCMHRMALGPRPGLEGGLRRPILGGPRGPPPEFGGKIDLVVKSLVVERPGLDGGAPEADSGEPQRPSSGIWRKS